MDMKAILKKELNDFLFAIAESYDGLVMSNIPDARFEKVVTEIQAAQDKTLNKLIEVSRQLADESAKAVIYQTHMSETPKELKEVVEDIVPKPTFLGPAPAPPRQVAEDTPPQMKQLLEAADRVSTGVGEALLDFGDDGELDHEPPTMTLAEEKRIEAGLPRKLYRPHIHVDHTGRQEVSPSGKGLITAPPLASSSGAATLPEVSLRAPLAARELFEQIRAVAGPLLQERNNKFREIGFKIIALTAQGLALDYALPSSREVITEDMEVTVEPVPFAEKINA